MLLRIAVLVIGFTILWRIRGQFGVRHRASILRAIGDTRTNHALLSRSLGHPHWLRAELSALYRAGHITVELPDEFDVSRRRDEQIWYRHNTPSKF